MPQHPSGLWQIMGQFWGLRTSWLALSVPATLLSWLSLRGTAQGNRVIVYNTTQLQNLQMRKMGHTADHLLVLMWAAGYRHFVV